MAEPLTFRCSHSLKEKTCMRTGSKGQRADPVTSHSAPTPPQSGLFCAVCDKSRPLGKAKTCLQLHGTSQSCGGLANQHFHDIISLVTRCFLAMQPRCLPAQLASIRLSDGVRQGGSGLWWLAAPHLVSPSGRLHAPSTQSTLPSFRTGCEERMMVGEIFIVQRLWRRGTCRAVPLAHALHEDAVSRAMLFSSPRRIDNIGHLPNHNQIES